MKTKKWMVLGLTALIALSGRADNITAKLDSDDGSSAFIVQDSSNNVLLTVHSSGKVGIGTNLPAANLHAVAGLKYFDTPMMERAGTTNDITPTALRLRATRDGDMGEGFGVGLQFTIQDDTETVNSAGVIGAVREAADNDTALFFRTRSASEGTVEHMRITSEGNVGIGTNAPVEKLHVDGAAVIGDSEASTPVAGTIRWTGSDFEGFNGNQWVTLTLQAGQAVPAGMARIPMGSFLMGPPDYTNTITISEFYIDKFEVTNQQMADVLQWAYDQGLVNASENTVTNSQGNAQELIDLSGASRISFSNDTFAVDSGQEEHPCTYVSWYGAQAYCNYKSDMDGLPRCIDFSGWSCDFTKRGYRLPTDAEWEKAARGGLVAKTYPWGDGTRNGDKANFYNSGDPYDNGTTPVGYYDGNQTPVGYDMANGYGLYDMAGNVWEWCFDRYDSSPPSDGTIDPIGSKIETNRIYRGGSWFSSASIWFECWIRIDVPPNTTYPTIGFRCARGF